MGKKTTNRSRGRPKSFPGKGKEATIRIRVTPTVKAALERKAQIQGVRLSEYMRELIARELDVHDDSG